MLACAAAIVLINFLPQQNNLSDVFKLLAGVLFILGVGGLALYWALVAFRLHYHLNRNGLAIQWGLAQLLIPFENIERIIPGQMLATPPKFRGLNLAGLRLGWAELTEFGRLKFLTTAALAESLLVVTPQQTYVISPRQPDHFVEAWQIRQALGPTQEWPVGLRRSWPFSYSLLADPLTWW
jgi:hypothetical protein